MRCICTVYCVYVRSCMYICNNIGTCTSTGIANSLHVAYSVICCCRSDLRGIKQRDMMSARIIVHHT